MKNRRTNRTDSRIMELQAEVSRLKQENAALRAELGERNPGPLRFMSFEDKLREIAREIVDVKEETKA